jgi:hypothetical protein
MKIARLASALLAFGFLLLGSSAAGNARADTPTVPTLQGELLATIGELFDRGASCNPDGTTTQLFHWTGVATGPYDGTFVEDGTLTIGPQTGIGPGRFGFQLGPVLTFDATYTIVSPTGTVTGTKHLVAPVGSSPFPLVQDARYADNTGMCTTFSGLSVLGLDNASGFAIDARGVLHYDATITTLGGTTTDHGLAFVEAVEASLGDLERRHRRRQGGLPALRPDAGAPGRDPLAAGGDEPGRDDAHGHCDGAQREPGPALERHGSLLRRGIDDRGRLLRDRRDRPVQLHVRRPAASRRGHDPRVPGPERKRQSRPGRDRGHGDEGVGRARVDAWPGHRRRPARSRGDYERGLVRVRGESGLKLLGTCSVVDPSLDVHVKCLDATALVQTGTHATFFGHGTVDGTPTAYRIDVDDLGEPGAGHDTFELQTGTGYTISGVLARGNVQIHG